MIEKILDFIEKNNMPVSGHSIICALSGGADSVCMTYVLYLLKEKLDIRLEAVHVNHGLRGCESDGDERFCRDFCDNIGIKSTVIHCDVKKYTDEHHISAEEAARILRYKAFSGISEGKIIATAHNANDNLETVILNLSRGSALKGLSGIPPVRDNIIRPLLCVSRNEIEEFLEKNGLKYVVDSTNLKDDYSRNRIRHNVIPQLGIINNSVVETSVHSLDVLREEEKFIENVVTNAYEKCYSDSSLYGLKAYTPLIRKRCIARLLSENSMPYSYDRLEEADNILLKKGKINISGDIFLISDGSVLKLCRIPPKNETGQISATLKSGSNSIFDNRRLFAKIIESKNFNFAENVNTNLATYYLDYDKIKGSVILRNRRFGDKIRLKGNDFTSSVKKLINAKVPPESRETMHFLEDEEGLIFAEYLGIDGRVAPDGNTLRFLEISIE